MYNSVELKKILIKGLKVNYSCSANKRIERILENKNIEDLEDLLQDLELLNLEGKTAQQMFKYIDAWAYGRKKEDMSTIELVVKEEEEEEENNELDKISYINYINSNNYVEKQSFDVESLGLTDKQREILNIYATTNSTRKTADFLGIHHSYVDKVLKTVRNKVEKIAI